MNAKTDTWLSWTFFLAGLAALGLAAYAGLAPEAAPVLEAPDTDREVTGAVAGTKVAVLFRLVNPTSSPIRVLGIGTC